MNQRQLFPSRSERGLLEGVLEELSILRRYRLRIAAATGSIAAAALALCLLTAALPPARNPLPNRYTASSTLLIRQADSGEASVFDSLTGDATARGSPAGFEYSAFLLRMLSSRVILDQIAQEFDLAHRYGLTASVRGRSREALLRNSHFLYFRESGLLTVSFQDTDPEIARDVVNRYVSLLGDWTERTRGDLRRAQSRLLEQKLLEVRSGMGALQEELKVLQRRYGFLTVQDLGAKQAATLGELRSRLILKEMEMRNYSSYAKVEDARLEGLRAERQNIVDLISQVEQGKAGAGAGEAELPDVAERYASLTLALDVQRGIYDELSRRHEVARLTVDPEPVFQVVEPAEAPDMKSGPQRSRIVVVAAVLALLASSALCRLNHAVRNLRQARRAGDDAAGRDKALAGARHLRAELSERA